MHYIYTSYSPLAPPHSSHTSTALFSKSRIFLRSHPDDVEKKGVKRGKTSGYSSMSFYPENQRQGRGTSLMPSGLSSKSDRAPQTQGKKRATQGQSPLYHSVKSNSPGIQMFSRILARNPNTEGERKETASGRSNPSHKPLRLSSPI